VDIAKSCDYAIRGLLLLAQRANPYEPVLLRDIAKQAGAPEAFLSKIFQNLRASSLVRSHRGAKRGYALARPPADISLYDIVVATEGVAALRSAPSNGPAVKGGDAFQRVWAEIEDVVAQSMKRTTLHSMLENNPEGLA